MKRQFEIQFPDDPTVLDVQVHDLRACMFNSETYIYPALQHLVTVTDITDEICDLDHDKCCVKYPDQDAWDELHVILAMDSREELGAAVEDWIHENILVSDPPVPSQTTLHGIPIVFEPHMGPSVSIEFVDLMDWYDGFEDYLNDVMVSG